MINVLIVDDHVLVRTCIKAHLSQSKEICVIAEASSGEEALKLARETKPNIVLMDLMMPGISSIEVINRLVRIYPDMKVIVLTGSSSNAFSGRLLDLGVRGYLTKESTADELVDAIIRVYKGERYIIPAIAQNLAMSNIDPRSASIFKELSNREFQIMMMIVNGYKVDYISDKLCLSPKTISSHRYAIFTKLNIKNDVELTHLAVKYSLLDIAAPQTLANLNLQLEESV